jgi:hypothetical protein
LLYAARTFLACVNVPIAVQLIYKARSSSYLTKLLYH